MKEILKNTSRVPERSKILLNVKTHRIYWHAGAGKDSEDTFDRYAQEKKELGEAAEKFDKKIQKEMEDLWKNQLEKQ